MRSPNPFTRLKHSRNVVFEGGATWGGGGQLNNVSVMHGFRAALDSLVCMGPTRWGARSEKAQPRAHPPFQNWKLQGLPSDDFSVENAIICTQSQRWSFMIDPQNQAKNWLMNLEKGSKLMVLQATDEDYHRSVWHSVGIVPPQPHSNLPWPRPAICGGA